jgi:hypothetical protein
VPRFSLDLHRDAEGAQRFDLTNRRHDGLLQQVAPAHHTALQSECAAQLRDPDGRPQPIERLAKTRIAPSRALPDRAPQQRRACCEAAPLGIRRDLSHALGDEDVEELELDELRAMVLKIDLDQLDRFAERSSRGDIERSAPISRERGTPSSEPAAPPECACMTIVSIGPLMRRGPDMGPSCDGKRRFFLTTRKGDASRPHGGPVKDEFSSLPGVLSIQGTPTPRKAAGLSSIDGKDWLRCRE